MTFTKVTFVIEADLLGYLTGERILELELIQTDVFRARTHVVEIEEIESTGDVSKRRKHFPGRSSQRVNP